MDVVKLIIEIILCIFSVFLIIVVLLQSGNRAGVPGSIGGGAEAIVGKSKARGLDAKLAKLTKIVSVSFMVLAVALVLIQRFWS